MSVSQLSDTLAQKLRRLAQDRPEIDSAQLQLIDLKDIAEAYGPRWSDVRERVFETSAAFLRKRLGEENALITCADGFVIVFGEAQGAEAELIGLKLSDALNKFFIGEPSLADFKVACRHRKLRLDEIDDLIREFKLGTGSSIVSGDQDASRDESARHSFLFRPVCDLKRNLIVNYFIEPIDQNGRPLDLGDYLSHSKASRSAFAELDTQMIEAATKALSAVLKSGDRILVGLTVHCEALADSLGRHKVLDALGHIDSEVRRYTMVRLTHVPAGFPRFHLDEQIRMLKLKAERVGLDVSVDDPNLDVFQHPELFTFGLNLPHYPDIHRPEMMGELASSVQVKARRIHGAGKRLAVTSDGAVSILNLCRDAGVDYVSALGLWPLQPAVQGIRASKLQNGTSVTRSTGQEL